MRFPFALIDGVILRRYKRFLVDVRLGDGSVTTAHCPNTGSMIGVHREGAACLLLDSANAERKLRYTLQAIRVGRTWVGAHPVMANAIGKEAIVSGLVQGVGPVRSVRAEVAYGRGSRADLVLEDHAGATWYVEIKSASLADGRTSMFPDAVTERGLKHLNELMRVVRAGDKALMLFVATRDDVDRFRPAKHIDPVYAKRLKQVARAGVVVRAITSRTTRTHMQAVRAIPIEL
jgi:sugar fermentation stimulation protein A